MPQTVSAKLDASGKRFAFVVARWNSFIVSKLVEGATDTVVRHGGDPESITLVYVPGSFELPLAAQKLARAGKHHAIVALGCILRGETPHFDHLAAEVLRGLSAAALATGVPISFGIIAADTLEQAIHRAGGKAGNKGAEAALAAIEMAGVMSAIGG